MMIDSYFTPASANSILPKIVDKLKMLAEIRGRLQNEERELSEAVSLNEFTRRKRRLNRTLADMYSLIEEIENYGCVIKDLDLYLLDFPAKMFGNDVWLCWKLGEPKVMFWHPKNEGFFSRRPIEP